MKLPQLYFLDLMRLGHLLAGLGYLRSPAMATPTTKACYSWAFGSNEELSVASECFFSGFVYATEAAEVDEVPSYEQQFYLDSFDWLLDLGSEVAMRRDPNPNC